MATETTVLNIEFGDLLDRIVKIKNATAELTEENEKLKKSTTEDTAEMEKNSKQIAANEAQIRALSKEKAALNKQVDTEIKLRRAEDGSIESNRAKLSKLTAEYIKLAKPTKEQTDAIKELSDKLKEQEGAIGNTSRNVGNYKEGIEGALKNVRVFGVSLGDSIGALKKKKNELADTAKGIGKVDLSTKGLTNGLKLFRVALAATGIGLIVVALTTLVGLLAKSETGMALVNKVTNILGATINVAVKRVETFAKAVGFFINGEFTKSIETATGAFTGMGEEITKATQAAAALADAQEELEDAEIGFIERRSKLRAEIEDFRDAANDETKAFGERKKALEQALKLQEELTNKEASIAKQRIETAETEFLLSAQTDEDRKKFEEAKAQAFEDDRSRTKEKIKLENELASLEKKNASDINQQRKEIDKENEQRRKEQEEELKKNQELLAELQKEITDDITNQVIEINKRAEAFRAAGASEADVLRFIEQETATVEQNKTDIILAEIDKRNKGIETGNATEILEINKKYNALILAAGNNKVEAERLEKEKQAALLEIQREALQQQLNQLQAEFESATASSEGGLIAEALGLTDEGKAELQSRIDEAKSRIEELGFTIGKLNINPDTGEPQDLLTTLGLDEAGVERFNESIGFIQETISGVSNIVSQASNQRIHELEREKEAAIQLAGDSTEERQRIEESYNAKIESEKRKAFEQTKKIKITESIIATALSVINAYNSGLQAGGPAGPIVGAIFAAIAAGIGVAQTALIAKSKYAKGGKVVEVGGKPHSEGGTKYHGEDGNAFEVERGEGIYVMKTTAQDAISKYSHINEMFGGNKWNGAKTKYAADGGGIAVASSFDGGFAARNAQTNIDTELLAQAIRNMPAPVVSVTEISRVTRSANQAVEVSEI